MANGYADRNGSAGRMNRISTSSVWKLNLSSINNTNNIAHKQEVGVVEGAAPANGIGMRVSGE